MKVDGWLVVVDGNDGQLVFAAPGVLLLRGCGTLDEWDWPPEPALFRLCPKRMLHTRFSHCNSEDVNLARWRDRSHLHRS